MAESSLQQSFSQQQSLAPQMRRSLEILQANSMELSQMVRQALETNPVLEDITEAPSLDEMGPDPEEADSLDYLNETDDDIRELMIMERRNQSYSQDDEERRDHLYNSIVAPETLQQHLAAQLQVALLDPGVRVAAEALLGNMDPRGFFDLPPTELGVRLGLPADDVESATAVIRGFDPPGIGAIDLRDSLLLQLERRGQGSSIEHRIVSDHLEDLARKRYPQIARALGTSIDRISEAAEAIGRLTPNPGGEYDPTGNPMIRADVIIEKEDEGWIARLTNEYLPKLRVSDFYKDLLGRTTNDTKARQFLRDNLREGRTLIRSLSLRQETILSIAEKLIEHQPDFLARGPRHLRPLTMNQIADELGLHATTVSRAVAGKYVLTPHGLMEMRSFFAAGYQTEDGKEVSNAGVREAIQGLISRESPSKPLSDEAIAKALKGQGIPVARRTVAKYRDQLGILPSHLRRTF
ncbi:RNA polymerase sigma-54 factor [Haloferula luteola]|uniref:RNA polymerase sigma-54 factor n=1 Tax=Haloferula luteola TaxID=595692 RepID=A0A840V4T4_9BACT|nr:RNA polymerase factor sigma-54 [Haloferula luteola]MBB5350644.1 RNA polymerase sigma-54 factor [Haloferula luteola]